MFIIDHIQTEIETKMIRRKTRKVHQIKLLFYMKYRFSYCIVKHIIIVLF